MFVICRADFDEGRLSAIAQEARKREQERLKRLKELQENPANSEEAHSFSAGVSSQLVSASSSVQKVPEVDVIELSSDEEVKEVTVTGRVFEKGYKNLWKLCGSYRKNISGFRLGGFSGRFGKITVSFSIWSSFLLTFSRFFSDFLQLVVVLLVDVYLKYVCRKIKWKFSSDKKEDD